MTSTTNALATLRHELDAAARTATDAAQKPGLTVDQQTWYDGKFAGIAEATRLLAVVEETSATKEKP